ncbi:MAG: hypothetical protein M3Y53_07615 [Thermoproteota archaeon]|nr:hypothetical protein [Thermoproteota archaeon]
MQKLYLQQHEHDNLCHLCIPEIQDVRAQDLLKGRFTLTKIWHIERKDEHNAIFGKFTDFSAESIDKMDLLLFLNSSSNVVQRAVPKILPV